MAFERYRIEIYNMDGVPVAMCHTRVNVHTKLNVSASQPASEWENNVWLVCLLADFFTDFIGSRTYNSDRYVLSQQNEHNGYAISFSLILLCSPLAFFFLSHSHSLFLCVHCSHIFVYLHRHECLIHVEVCLVFDFISIYFSFTWFEIIRTDACTQIDNK